MYTFLLSMTIDENRVLISYSRKKITPSDYYLLITKFNFPWNDKAILKKSRYVIFNFKDAEGLKKYKEMTSSDILSNCLESDNRSSELAYKKWLKEFENILQMCFKKLQLTSKC